MRRSIILWLSYFVIQMLCVSITNAQQSLVLVAHISSPVNKITSKQIRKLYFGIPVKINGYSVVPVRNTSDPLVYQMFLQKVIFLSSRDYERQIISRTFKRGGRMPESISELSNVIKTIRLKPNTITFLPAEFADQHDDLKVIKVLWKGADE